MAQVIKNRLLKVVAIFFASLFFLLLLLMLLVDTPWMQTKIVNALTKAIDKKTGFTTRVDKVGISWFDQGTIEGIKVYDPEKNLMVSLRELEIDLNLWAVIKGEFYHIDHLHVDRPSLFITPNALNDSTTILNINAFIGRLLPKKKDTAKVFPPIVVNSTSVTNGTFAYNLTKQPHTDSVFNANNFTIEDIEGQTNQLRINRDTVQIDITSLTAREKSAHIDLHHLHALMTLSRHSLSFDGLSVNINNSKISDTVSMHYKSIQHMKYFIDSVDVYAHLANAEVYFDDIRRFIPKLPEFKEKLTVSGIFRGPISDFQFDRFSIETGQTRLKGTARLSGLPKTNETFIDIRLNPSQVSATDIAPLLKTENKAPFLALGTASLSGQFLGYLNDFVAFGKFKTRYGIINSDINLKIAEQFSASRYKGKLELKGFQLGDFTNNPNLGTLSFNGSINGKGFKLNHADLEINGQIDTIEILNYKYINISTNGQLAHQYYDGKVTIDDPNLKFEAEGVVDFNDSTESFHVTSKLEKINFKPLGLYKEDLTLSGDANFDFKGLTVDEIEGYVQVSDVHLTTPNREVYIDSLQLISKRGEQRDIQIISSIIEAKVHGNYSFRKAYVEIQTLLTEYIKILRNDEEDIRQLNLTLKNKSVSEFDLDYYVHLKEVNPLLSIFTDRIKISDHTTLEGKFSNGHTAIFNFTSSCDTLHIDKNIFINNLIEVNTSKISDTTQILAMAYIESEKQQINQVEFENLLLESIWNNNLIDFTLNLGQERFNNAFNVLGKMEFQTQETKITIDQSDMSVLGKPWLFDLDNLITIKDTSIYFTNLRAYGEEQEIKIDGVVSKDSSQTLIISFDNLDVMSINSFINKELAGRLDGNILLSNLYSNTRIENDLIISKFSINKFLVGDIEGTNKWNVKNQHFDLDLTVKDQGEEVMRLRGYYNPKLSESINIDAELNNIRLNIVEPFIGQYFSELKGTSIGRFKITGTPLSPKVTGRGEINNGQMVVNYLMTPYDFTGGFTFSEEYIRLDEITISDPFNNQGTMTGTIAHSGFRRMILDLSGQFRNIQLLNTSAKDNTLFYGQGFGTGTVKFSGPTSNLTIAADVRTDKETRIYIPIGGIETADIKDFITFVDFSDTTFTSQNENKKLDLKGINLDFNIDVTTDAYCEIIFDIKAGDIIRGRGTGDLNLKIDSNGEFNMFGSLGIVQGWYNFTLYNLINKEFTVLPGGVINWYGDPYAGIMDLKASYDQSASVSPVLNPAYKDAPEVRRKYPARVIMDIKGPLLNPEIDFDILSEGLPRNVSISSGETINLEFEFESFKNRIDEQELKRQVFSLIVLRRFSPPESFNTGGAISNSVSELFSNQLSYWMSQVDDNLEIDFDLDLSSLDQEAFNTFQLRLSYTFLDGRLRVSRDGSFVNYENQVSATSLAGDWSVEYLLTPDGRMKVRMYNRTNYDNTRITQEGNYSTTTGVSLQYTRSFNEFFAEMARIFKSNKKEQEKKEQEKEEPVIKSEAKLNEEENDE